MVSRKSLVYYLPLVLAVIPVIEGRWFPQAPPADYAPNSVSHPAGLVRGISENITTGTILVMPPEVEFSQVAGTALYAAKAVLAGRGGEVRDLLVDNFLKK